MPLWHMQGQEITPYYLSYISPQGLAAYRHRHFISAELFKEHPAQIIPFLSTKKVTSRPKAYFSLCTECISSVCRTESQATKCSWHSHPWVQRQASMTVVCTHKDGELEWQHYSPWKKQHCQTRHLCPILKNSSELLVVTSQWEVFLLFCLQSKLS